MLAAAEMYVKGVSTRDVEKVLAEFGIEGLSSTQVSRAAAMLDAELEAWRNRSLGRFRYLFLDARYEKTREQGVADDCAVLSAIGIDPLGRPRAGRLRRVLRGRGALARLSRKPRGARPARRRVRHLRRSFRSQGRPQSRAARRPLAALPVSPRPECHPPRAKSGHPQGHRRGTARRLGRPEPRKSGEELKRLVAKYRTAAPKLAGWLENNVPEGLAVFKLPREHWRTMRTSNPIERSIQQELKRRTRKIRVFPNEASLIRLVSAILVEIDEQWAASQKPYVNFNNTNAD